MDVISFVVHLASYKIVSYLKTIFIAVSFLLFLFTIVLIAKTEWVKWAFWDKIAEFFTYKPRAAKKAFKRWAKITKKLDSNKESDYKLAVIEADSLLEEILEKIGYKGETLKDRLDQLDEEILPNIKEVREAHQVRNDIVHDPDYRLGLDQASKILAVYEEAFRKLELF
ncbi:MAG TPA: hypothetical protein ENL27_01110 [Candidatus Parcubacteria bacterium]|nr:hypothetical protein [Candidatus Parcubacteria bacterium]